MLPHLILTAVQARILLALLLGEGSGTGLLLRMVGISGRTWSKEREKLASLNLLTIKERRSFSNSGVKTIKDHRLTKKGIKIANDLREISDLLANSDKLS